MQVGEHTYGHEGIIIRSWGEGKKLIIGKFCSIALNVRVYLGGNHRTDWITTYPFGHVGIKKFSENPVQGHPSTNGDVVVGNDVWIGDYATIMSGIKIGNGAVIAANSHVVKDVPVYSIVGGNPAKVIKYRFSQEQIEKLEKIQWWNWEDQKIKENVNLLCSNNIDEFINKFK
jgi:acetyltransferase-like isoleucine patch superfamily enzyme